MDPSTHQNLNQIPSPSIKDPKEQNVGLGNGKMSETVPKSDDTELKGNISFSKQLSADQFHRVAAIYSFIERFELVFGDNVGGNDFELETFVEELTSNRFYNILPDILVRLTFCLLKDGNIVVARQEAENSNMNGTRTENKRLAVHDVFGKQKLRSTNWHHLLLNYYIHTAGRKQVRRVIYEKDIIPAENEILSDLQDGVVNTYYLRARVLTVGVLHSSFAADENHGFSGVTPEEEQRLNNVNDVFDKMHKQLDQFWGGLGTESNLPEWYNKFCSFCDTLQEKYSSFVAAENSVLESFPGRSGRNGTKVFFSNRSLVNVVASLKEEVRSFVKKLGEEQMEPGKYHKKIKVPYLEPYEDDIPVGSPLRAGLKALSQTLHCPFGFLEVDEKILIFELLVQSLLDAETIRSEIDYTVGYIDYLETLAHSDDSAPSEEEMELLRRKHAKKRGLNQHFVGRRNFLAKSLSLMHKEYPKMFSNKESTLPIVQSAQDELIVGRTLVYKTEQGDHWVGRVERIFSPAGESPKKAKKKPKSMKIRLSVKKVKDETGSAPTFSYELKSPSINGLSKTTRQKTFKCVLDNGVKVILQENEVRKCIVPLSSGLKRQPSASRNSFKNIDGKRVVVNTSFELPAEIKPLVEGVEMFYSSRKQSTEQNLLDPRPSLMYKLCESDEDGKAVMKHGMSICLKKNKIIYMASGVFCEVAEDVDFLRDERVRARALNSRSDRVESHPFSDIVFVKVDSEEYEILTEFEINYRFEFDMVNLKSEDEESFNHLAELETEIESYEVNLRAHFGRKTHNSLTIEAHGYEFMFQNIDDQGLYNLAWTGVTKQEEQFSLPRKVRRASLMSINDMSLPKFPHRLNIFPELYVREGELFDDLKYLIDVANRNLCNVSAFYTDMAEVGVIPKKIINSALDVESLRIMLLKLETNLFSNFEKFTVSRMSRPQSDITSLGEKEISLYSQLQKIYEEPPQVYRRLPEPPDPRITFRQFLYLTRFKNEQLAQYLKICLREFFTYLKYKIPDNELTGIVAWTKFSGVQNLELKLKAKYHGNCLETLYNDKQVKNVVKPNRFEVVKHVVKQNGKRTFDMLRNMLCDQGFEFVENLSRLYELWSSYRGVFSKFLLLNKRHNVPNLLVSVLFLEENVSSLFNSFVISPRSFFFKTDLFLDVELCNLRPGDTVALKGETWERALQQEREEKQFLDEHNLAVPGLGGSYLYLAENEKPFIKDGMYQIYFLKLYPNNGDPYINVTLGPISSGTQSTNTKPPIETIQDKLTQLRRKNRAKNYDVKKYKSSFVSQLNNGFGSDQKCFICGTGGSLTLCDEPKCPRVYHQECLHEMLRRGGDNETNILSMEKFRCPLHHLQKGYFEFINYDPLADSKMDETPKQTVSNKVNEEKLQRICFNYIMLKVCDEICALPEAKVFMQELKYIRMDCFNSKYRNEDEITESMTAFLGRVQKEYIEYNPSMCTAAQNIFQKFKDILKRKFVELKCKKKQRRNQIVGTYKEHIAYGAEPESLESSSEQQLRKKRRLNNIDYSASFAENQNKRRAMDGVVGYSTTCNNCVNCVISGEYTEKNLFKCPEISCQNSQIPGVEVIELKSRLKLRLQEKFQEIQVSKNADTIEMHKIWMTEQSLNSTFFEIKSLQEGKLINLIVPLSTRFRKFLKPVGNR
eukprot:snap_masked-scaffold_7-processed-gene-15.5-mRNA-1 protein AED:1.00 eAED:1.00 QI:0/0/0/0/1/1/4/0/1664